MLLLISALSPKDPKCALGSFCPLGSTSSTLLEATHCVRATFNQHAQWSRDAEEAEELEPGAELSQ